MLVNTVIAAAYQGLFDLMSNEHGLNLTKSEMDEIINEARKVSEKVNGLEFDRKVRTQYNISNKSNTTI